MDKEQFRLTVEQQGLLASLALETGKPIPVLLSEALAALQDHVHGHPMHVEAEEPTMRDAHGETNGGAVPSASKPIWEVADELFSAIPDAELALLPVDGAAQ